MKLKKMFFSLLISGLFAFILVPGLSLTTSEPTPLDLCPPAHTVV